MAEQSANKGMKIRIIVIAAMITIVGVVVLTMQLWKIQFVKGEEYSNRAVAQQMRSTPIAAKRGTIYDRNGNPLAQSATVWTVYISPADIETEVENGETKSEAEQLADILSTVLDVDRDSILEKCQDQSSYYKTIKKKLTKPEADAVMNAIEEQNRINKERKGIQLGGVHLEEDNKRFYPYGNFASTVIGFTNDENKGAYGIEAYYDKLLSGTPGRVVASKNALGTDMPQRYQEMYEAKDGNSLVLTLDEVVQHYLEKNLEIAVVAHGVKSRVTGIVMDVNTGEILGMATKNDFDPNKPNEVTDPLALSRLEGLTGDTYKEQLGIEQFAQWRNKAVSDPYEPGSVFKLITLASGLESGTSTMNDSFTCYGVADIAGTKIHCWKTSGHGPQDLTHGLINSCNPFFIHVGQKMGADTFNKYFEGFGLTEKTGIDIPGEAQGIYHPFNKMGVVELASSSFGQTFKITPIQLITAAAATLNGGYLLKPYVVKEVIDPQGNVVESYSPVVKRQVVSEETSRQVAEAAEKVVSEGSGNLAYVPGYRIGGKTGTSQKLDKKDENGQVTDHVLSFLGFAPADDPQIACLVLVDEPELKTAYGSTLAAPIVGAIMSDILPYLGIEPQYTAEELEKKNVYCRDVVGQKPHEAQGYLTEQGLKSKLIGSGASVIKQVPEAGMEIAKGATVILYTEEEAQQRTVTVPRVIGMSGQMANKSITNVGLNVHFVGADMEDTECIAVTQSPEEGTEVELGAIVTVEFVNKDSAENISNEPVIGGE